MTMERDEALAKIRKYNESISKKDCSLFEKALMRQIDEKNYFHWFMIQDNEYDVPDDVEDFLYQNKKFSSILKGNSEKLCLFLRHMHEFSCNHSLIRMNARSKRFSHYAHKALQAVAAFYLFYGLELDMKDAIYGQYRQFPFRLDCAPIIAAELLQGNVQVIQYCKEVITSENNTAVITRDVIKAIEMAKVPELHKLLLDLFLAAKLQEGLRQSVIETIDEYQIEPFFAVIDLIKSENLIRFSSIQRGVMTWIGIGYDLVEDEKQIKVIFDTLYDFIHDESQRKQGLSSENPMHVYLALYCQGVFDVEDAIAQAVELLFDSRRHIVAAALIYLRLTSHFEVLKYMDLPSKHSDDEWIWALYISECCRIDFSKRELTLAQAEKLFGYMKSFVKGIKTQQRFSSKGFGWYSIMVHRDSLIRTMFQIIQSNCSQNMVEEFLPYVSSMFHTQITLFMESYFSKVSEEKKQPFLLKEIISGSEALSEHVTREYMNLSLNEDEIIQLEGRLKSKKAYARANVVKVLANQKPEQVKASYQRLKASNVKTISESAIELKRLKPELFVDETELDKEAKESVGMGAAIEKESTVFVQSIPSAEIVGKEEGFSLYQPRYPYHIDYPSRLKVTKKGFIKKTTQVDVSFLQVMNKEQVLNYIKKWSQRIKEHALEEYEVRGEIRQIGHRSFFPLNYSEKSLDALPLGSVWRKYFEEDNLSAGAVFQLSYLTQCMGINYSSILPSEIVLIDLHDSDLKDVDYYHHYQTIINRYRMERTDIDSRYIAAQYLELMNKYTTYKQYRDRLYGNETAIYSVAKLSPFAFMRSQLNLMETTDEEFAAYFPVLYESYEEFNLKCRKETLNKFNFNPLELARAVALNLVPVKALYEALLDDHTEYKQSAYSYRSRKTHRLFEGYRDAYYHGKGTWGKPDMTLPEEHKDAYIVLREALDRIADTLLPMEASRINEETEVTDCVGSFLVVRGMKHLIMALRVLEGEDIKRQTYGNDRNTVFSNVIRHCYPMNGDTADGLRREGFSEKRLVEVAMMAPQWIDMVQEVLGWEGFKDACYYFIAHMKQYDHDKKKAEIAQYTELEPIDLNDGAFDMEWCKSIYKILGEKRFSMIYQAAKFLCENSFHTRARKYADACLAKESKESFLVQAVEKRNKDALNAYCICPIEDDKDLLERYLYIQKFLKESKAFGAQRQTSEKRACEIALMNLAKNSRFETVTRLSWILETEVINQYQQYFVPQAAGDVEIWIEIDEFGQNEIKVSKNGKAQKSIPSKLKNDELVITIKEVHAILSQQFKRSKQMLQTAMEERIVFGKEEMDAIAKNPVVGPMLNLLVLRNAGHFGFYKDGVLQGLTETYPVEGDIYIAHSFDLYQAGVWKDYQKYLFEKQMVQPFKQIFRELYLKLEEERPLTYTKRYTGYQIQPQKAAGALKSRRWNASYESGLERVCHRENLIVHLYADADWFSPSDIEAPSIDYVAFFNRKDNKPREIGTIDDVVFSEMMRDVDLAVSTAYVGGVDPVTSFSTIELRRAIVEYTCSLMKLSNVTVQENFANIQGAHNNYHVHLGSGMVHQDGGGSIYMIPVWSGKRGKVYLPFLDEDPMSAQILTKVIMLAEDSKIKDPSILSQIETKK